MTSAVAPDSSEASLPQAQVPFHVMTKPIGSLCNLACSYCFYLEKAHLYSGKRDWRMPPEVLETYIRDYISAQPTSPSLPLLPHTLSAKLRCAGTQLCKSASD